MVFCHFAYCPYRSIIVSQRHNSWLFQAQQIFRQLDGPPICTTHVPHDLYIDMFRNGYICFAVSLFPGRVLVAIALAAWVRSSLCDEV